MRLFSRTAPHSPIWEDANIDDVITKIHDKLHK